MKSALHIELQLLFRDNPRALYLLSFSEISGPQWCDHKADAANSLTEVLPSKPSRGKFAPDSFWSKFCQKQVWPAVFKASPERQQTLAAWLRQQRERAGNNWPPPVRTSRATGHPPPVRTGKE